MKNSLAVFILFFSILTLNSFSQGYDPYKYYEEDDSDYKKNYVFSDFSYFFKPIYNIGYGRMLEYDFSINAALMITKYSNPYEYFLMYYYEREDIILKPISSNINFQFEVYYHIQNSSKNWNRIGLGMHFFRFDYANFYDFYLNKTLYSVAIDKKIAISVDFQIGARLFKLKSSNILKDYNSINITKTYGNVFFHIPVKLTYLF